MRTIRPFALAFLAIPMTLPSFAQTKTERASVDWGAARDEREHGNFSGVVHKTDDHIYVTVTKNKETWLQLFDKGLNMLKSVPLPLKVDKDEHDWELLMFQDDRILFFTSNYNKSDKATTLYVRDFGLTDLGAMQPVKAIRSVPSESKRDRGWFNVYRRTDAPGFKVSESVVDDEGGTRRWKTLLYDMDLSLYDEVFEERDPPYPYAEYDVESSYTDKDGSRVMVVRKYPEKREKKERKREGKPTFDFVLVVYPPGSPTCQKYPINVQDKFLQDIRIRIPEDEGDILCAGFYGNKASWSVRGAFFLRLDRSSKEIVHESYKEFDLDFITGELTEKQEERVAKRIERKGDDLEMLEYDLDDIVFRDDGGAILVGEQYHAYVRTRTTTNAQGITTTRSTYHYIYNDIIAISTDPQGNIEWAVRIPKRQHTTNDGGYYSSYAMAVKGDKLYFVFNDNGKNLFLGPGVKVEQFDLTGKEALITLVTVDSEGTMQREALLAPDKRDAILRPKSCFQMEDDRMFIYASRKKEYRYGMMTFD